MIEEGKGKEMEKEDAVDIHCVLNWLDGEERSEVKTVNADAECYEKFNLVSLQSSLIAKLL